MTNRIKELREARGLSASKLAELVGTSQPQIARLESGERRLTVGWMTRISKALNCAPADLMLAVTLADIEDDELAPFISDAGAAGAAMAAKGLAFYKIATDNLEQILAPGSIILVDMSEAAIAAIRTGDIVIAFLQELPRPAPRLRSVPPIEEPPQGAPIVRTVVRQFIAPNLLITNRQGNNVVVGMVNDSFEVHIRGVMVPEKSN